MRLLFIKKNHRSQTIEIDGTLTKSYIEAGSINNSVQPIKWWPGTVQQGSAGISNSVQSITWGLIE
jgi:hypothetical protein